MFSIFKNSNEKKLQARLKDEFTNTTITLFNNSGMKDTPLAGTILLRCIADTKNECMRRKYSISSYHNVSLVRTVEIIEETAEKVTNELLE